jgi:hypothetical protein
MSWSFTYSDVGSTILNTATPSAGAPSTVVIPSNVVEIRDATSFTTSIFYNNRFLITSIVLPNTIRKIGNYAFNNCTNLSSIIGLSSISSIGTYAFYGCSKLSTLNNNNLINTLPGTLSFIGRYAFYNCAPLTYLSTLGQLSSLEGNVYDASGISTLSLQINPSISTIGASAFTSATRLSTFYINDNSVNTLPSNISSIGASAFSICRGLKYISIPGQLESIGSGSFSGTSIISLSLKINPSISTIWGSAFSGMTNLSSFTINDNPGNILPSNISSIGASAFYNCLSLSSITILGKLSSLGAYAFSGTPIRSLALQVVPTLSSITTSVFNGMSLLSSFTINDGPPNTLPSSIMNIEAIAFHYCTALTYLSTFGQLSSINATSFTNTSISSLNLTYAPSASTIRSTIFGGAPTLSTFVINNGPPNAFPSTMTMIDTYALQYMTGLTYISTLGNITSIGSQPFFYSNISTVSIRFNASLTTIPQWAFANSISLSTLVVNDGPPNTLPSSITGLSNNAFLNCPMTYLSTLGDLVVFGQGAGGIFTNTGISSLSLRFSNTLRSIPGSAFISARNLSTFVINNGPPNTIPSSIISIGNSAFSGCWALTYLSTLGNISSFGLSPFAFSGISTISLRFSTTLTTLPPSIFANASTLSTIYINDGPPNMLPSTINSISSLAFSGCPSIEYISTAGPLRSISANAFASSFISTMALQFSTTMSTLDASAFANASRLSLLNINGGPANMLPSSIRTIGAYAFSGCSSLTYLSTAGPLISIASNAFTGSFISSMELRCSSIFSTLAASAFSGATNLSTFRINDLPPNTLPSSITTINSNAFFSCTGLKYLSTLGLFNAFNGLNIFAGSGISSLSMVFNSTIGFLPTGTSFITGAAELSTFVINGGPPNTLPSSISSIRAGFVNCKGLRYLSTLGLAGTAIWTGAIARSGISSISLNYLSPAPAFITGLNEAAELRSVYINGGPENTLPSSIVAVSDFSGCSSIEYLNIQGNITTFGISVFTHCKNLSSISFGVSSILTSIPSRMFSYCNNLSRVIVNEQDNIFPSTITSINTYAFENCVTLSSLRFNGNLTSFGANCFNNCTNLSSISFGTSTVLTTLPDGIFTNDVALRSININSQENIFPSTVTTIGASVFTNCSSLSNIILNGNLTSIGISSFYNCTALSSISFGTSTVLTTLPNGTFANCTALRSIIVNGRENIFPSSITTVGLNVFENWQNLSTIKFNGNLTYIGASSFHNCSNLSSISFGTAPSFSTITAGVFTNCTALEDINVNEQKNIYPNSVIFVGVAAFMNCINLKNINFNGNLNILEKSTFINCVKLSSISFSIGTVIDLQDSLFLGCSSLTSITVNNQLNIFPSSISIIGSNTFKDCSNLKDVRFNGNMSRIGENSFANCINISSIALGIGPMFKTLSNGLFANCYNLQNITINNSETDIIFPSSMNIIGDNIFTNCNNLSGNISINGLLSELRMSTFHNCYKISSIALNIDPSMTSIQDGLFTNCYNLKNITINSIDNTFPSSITSLGDFAFANCYSLSSLIINGTISALEQGLFLNMASLSILSLNLHSSITTLPSTCISGCSSLKRLILNGQENTLPSTVEYISSYAFQQTGMNYLKLNGTLKHLGEGAFSQSNIPEIDCNIESSITQLEAAVFASNSISTLIINNKVNTLPSFITILGDNAFNGTRLEYLDIEGTIISTGTSALSLPKASTITINFHPNYSTMTLGLFRFAYGLSTLTINGQINTVPSSISKYVNDPFRATGLSYIKFEGPVENISPNIYDFSESPNLSTIIINYASSQTTLGYLAFADCPNLSKIIVNGRENEFPSSIVNIQTSAFQNTKITHLTFNGPGELRLSDPISELSTFKVNIDPSVTAANAARVGRGGMPPKLSTIIMNDRENELPDFIQTIQDISWNGGHALKNLIFPSSITYIGPDCFVSTPGILNTIKNTLPSVHTNTKLTNSLLVYFNLQEKQYHNSTCIVSNVVQTENSESQGLISIQNMLNTNSYEATVLSTGTARINSFNSITMSYSTVILSIKTEQTISTFNLNIAANKYSDNYAKLQTQTANNFNPELYDVVKFSIPLGISSIRILHKDDQNITTRIGPIVLSTLYTELGPDTYTYRTIQFKNGIEFALEGISNNEYNIKYTGPFSETVFTTMQDSIMEPTPPAQSETIIPTNSHLDCSLMPPYNATNFTPANSAVFNTLLSYAKTQPQYPWTTGSDAQQIYRSQQNISYFNAMNQQTITIKNSVAPLSGKQYPQFKTQSERMMYIDGQSLTAARNMITGQNPSAPAGVPCSTIYQIINS